MKYILFLYKIFRGQCLDNDLSPYRHVIENGKIIIDKIYKIFGFVDTIRIDIFNECWNNIDEFINDKNNIYKAKDFINKGYISFTELCKTFNKNNLSLMNELKILKPNSIIFKL